MENNVWYKVDNVAKVFLATANKRDTRSFRVSCTLKETIEPDLLNQALHITVEQRPQYQVTIHKGLFWHYMEVTDKEIPVKEESDRPCPYLYGPDYTGKLHYVVTYFHNRINLDMFHALADGNGGLDFLNIIVQNYLKLKYPEELKNVSIYNGAAAADLEEDSFKQFFRKTKVSTSSLTPAKAYQIKGMKLPYKQMQFFEFHMSAKAIHDLAKQCQVSMTSYLGARLMMAIYEDMPALQKNKPIAISMPVNLRNYYPSETLRNFFNSVSVIHTFQGDETLEELAQEFDAKLKEELTPERVKERMDNYEKMESLMPIRMVPLFLKNPTVKYFTKKEEKSVSAIISNLGRLSVPEEMCTFIKGYAAYCSSNTLFLTICSYGDDLTFGIASLYRNTSVLKNFVRHLTGDGVEITVGATDVVRY